MNNTTTLSRSKHNRTQQQGCIGEGCRAPFSFYGNSKVHGDREFDGANSVHRRDCVRGGAFPADAGGVLCTGPVSAPPVIPVQRFQKNERDLTLVAQSIVDILTSVRTYDGQTSITMQIFCKRFEE